MNNSTTINVNPLNKELTLKDIAEDKNFINAITDPSVIEIKINFNNQENVSSSSLPLLHLLQLKCSELNKKFIIENLNTNTDLYKVIQNTYLSTGVYMFGIK